MCQHMGYYSTFRWVIPRFRVGYLRVTNPFAMAASRYAPRGNPNVQIPNPNQIPITECPKRLHVVIGPEGVP